MGRFWAKIPFAIAAVMVALSAPAAASTAHEAASPTAAATATAFPLSITTADGTARIPSRPGRILCLSASATQMLYALGAGPQVVGVDKYSTYPAGAPRTKFTGYEPNAEEYLYLHPDLVIFAFKSGTLVQQLNLLHIPALVLPPATGITDVYQQIAELAAATGHRAAAHRVQSSLEADVNTAVRSAGNAGKGDTYYIELDTTLYTATSGTFIGAEFSLFGMKDIADAAGHGNRYPQISPEYLVTENPDYVFLADTVCCHQNAATFAKRAGFSALRAVRLHHVIGINDSVASQWGPHTIQTFVSLLARTLRS